MKKTTLKLFLIWATSILILSCSTNSTIGFTKRHYRNGYYLETYSAVKMAKEKSAQTLAISVENSNPVENSIGKDQSNSNESSGRLVKAAIVETRVKKQLSKSKFIESLSEAG